jgi:hypothetical protein
MSIKGPFTDGETHIARIIVNVLTGYGDQDRPSPVPSPGNLVAFSLLNLFSVCSTPCFAMWKTATERRDFVFMVRMGLRRGLF